MQAKDRELVQAQQQLREKVNRVNYIMFHVLCLSSCIRNSYDPVRV